jgi:hypothetical protein
MTLAEVVVDVWRRALTEDREEVEVAGARYPVTRTRGKGLRAVSFLYDGQLFEGIEQNPETKSRWAALAREGSRIMQFKFRGRYIGNVCDGNLMRYPSWKGMGLGD